MLADSAAVRWRLAGLPPRPPRARRLRRPALKPSSASLSLSLSLLSLLSLPLPLPEPLPEPLLELLLEPESLSLPESPAARFAPLPLAAAAVPALASPACGGSMWGR
jgi:hypothetical protein